MNNQKRKGSFIIIYVALIACVIFALGMFVGYELIPTIKEMQEISVYRISSRNDDSNCSILFDTDFISSQKSPIIEPTAKDTQYIVDLKSTRENFSVHVYRSLWKGWEEIEVIDLGNEQYSIPAVYISEDSTNTYCVTIIENEKSKKYYWTVKKN